jgi:hypothetical protein
VVDDVSTVAVQIPVFGQHVATDKDFREKRAIEGEH